MNGEKCCENVVTTIPRCHSWGSRATRQVSGILTSQTHSQMYVPTPRQSERHQAINEHGFILHREASDKHQCTWCNACEMKMNDRLPSDASYQR